jgi:wyosine [tRNA(Phe)-imidazoG37] synthetase (radical SAM superfamily)
MATSAGRVHQSNNFALACAFDCVYCHLDLSNPRELSGERWSRMQDMSKASMSNVKSSCGMKIKLNAFAAGSRLSGIAKKAR